MACACAAHAIDGFETRLSDGANGGVDCCGFNTCSMTGVVEKPSALNLFVSGRMVWSRQPEILPGCMFCWCDVA